MVAVDKAIVSILRDSAVLPGIIGSDTLGVIKVYAPLVPQNRTFPFVRVAVDGVEPYDTKTGPACTEKYFVSVDCFSENPEECFNMASAVRTALDRFGQNNYVDVEGIKLRGIQFLNAREDPFREDKLDVFVWTLDFGVRVFLND